MQPKMTRRSFLQGSALGTAGAAAGLLDGARAFARSDGEAPAGAGGATDLALELSVNGARHKVVVEARATLAEVLRVTLGLTGTKIACGRGACSACTVLLDGAPADSCMLLAADVGAREVTTIEGLARGGALHPVQQAFIDHDAMQCGYCTPGMVLSCVALLARQPRPSAAQVRDAISGHICRCGTYPHVVAAVLDVAAESKAGL